MFNMSLNSTNQTDVFRRYAVNTLLEEFAPVGIMAEKIVPPIWYTAGFIGNPLSALIWLGQRMRRNNSSAVYLGFLSLSDMLFLILHLIYILHNSWGFTVYNNYTSCEVFHLFFYAPQYLSTLLVLGFTMERYVAVCHPFLKEKWCTVKRALVIVLFLFIFSLLLASAQSYIWTYDNVEDTCSYRPSAMVGDEESFSILWTRITEIIVFGLVPVIVLVFNILVIMEICRISRNDLVKRQQSRKGNGATSTVTLLAVSFYLILTQLSATVVNILAPAFPYGDIYLSDDEMREDRKWVSFFTYMEIRKVVEVIALSHNACYFFIYLATGKHFQKEMLYLLTFHGRLPFLATLLSARRGKEHYSMVSTNGCPVSEMYTTNVSTTI